MVLDGCCVCAAGALCAVSCVSGFARRTRGAGVVLLCAVCVCGGVSQVSFEAQTEFEGRHLLGYFVSAFCYCFAVTQESIEVELIVMNPNGQNNSQNFFCSQKFTRYTLFC